MPGNDGVKAEFVTTLGPHQRDGGALGGLRPPPEIRDLREKKRNFPKARRSLSGQRLKSATPSARMTICVAVRSAAVRLPWKDRKSVV